MTRKESLHGAGNQSKRTESVWTPRDSSKVGPVDGFGPTKGAEASVGPLNISSPQAQTQRKYPASVKGKKGIDRGLSQSFPSNSDRASVRELSSAKSPSLPPFHVSSLNRASADLSFTFSASSSEPKRSDVADEDLSDLTEQQCLGDGSNGQGQFLCGGNGVIVVEKSLVLALKMADKRVWGSARWDEYSLITATKGLKKITHSDVPLFYYTRLWHLVQFSL
ncbi:hypothetical protein CFP56_024726 [Quercus suber]|uniref:Uncharacterized protein n=1 Tax=Quercus suber TaxID=58331 RepID=A0AAW0K4U5_QUESU